MSEKHLATSNQAGVKDRSDVQVQGTIIKGSVKLTADVSDMTGRLPQVAVIPPNHDSTEVAIHEGHVEPCSAAYADHGADAGNGHVSPPLDVTKTQRPATYHVGPDHNSGRDPVTVGLRAHLQGGYVKNTRAELEKERPITANESAGAGAGMQKTHGVKSAPALMHAHQAGSITKETHNAVHGKCAEEKMAKEPVVYRGPRVSHS